ncbi:MAG: hypothetical protein V3W41_20200 [Planctomycetota bacterium]
MNRILITLVLFAAAVLPLQAQLQIEDAILATTTGMTHIRALASTPVVPNATDANPILTSGFATGSILSIPGTSLVLYAEGGAAAQVFLLEFAPGAGGGVGTGIAGPASTLLGVAAGSVINMAYDSENDVAYLLTTPGAINTITGPITSTSQVDSLLFASGQSGGVGIAVGANNQLLVASAAEAWPVNGGDVAPNATFITFVSSGIANIEYDAANDRFYTSALNLSSVHVYDGSTGTLFATPLSSPNLLICDACSYSPASDMVYGITRFATTIQGVPQYGNNPISAGAFDNVLVCTDLVGGNATAMGCSPQSGHGNAGLNTSLAIVQPLRGSIDFDPASNILNFNTATNTVSATLTVLQLRFGGLITSSAVDPLVGSTVLISGDYTGTDLVDLTDIDLSNVNVEFFQTSTPPGTADNTYASASPSNAGASTGFTGQRQATPFATRVFDLGTATMVTGAGGTSAVLTAISDLVSTGSRIGFDVSISSGGIGSLTLNPVAKAAPYETRIASSGNGDLEIGTIGAVPMSFLYHIGTTMISTPTNSGPFFGLTADSNLFTQIQKPFFTDPFVVASDANGQYNFFLSAGFVASGVSLDYVGINYDSINVIVNILPARNTIF